VTCRDLEFVVLQTGAIFNLGISVVETQFATSLESKMLALEFLDSPSPCKDNV